MPRKTLSVAAVILVAGAIAGALMLRPEAPPAPPDLSSASSTLALAGERLEITVATSSADLERGLGGREGLDENEGMLFVFATDGKYAFWMKDMLFPIDILWLSADGRVVDIARGVSPESYPRTFTPAMPARYVLEVSAGWAEAHGVRVGDRAVF